MEEHKIFFYYIGVLSSAVSLIPFIISLINIKKISSELKPLFFLIIINVIMEIINFIFTTSGIDNQYIFHYFTVLEFGLISLFYSFFFKQFFNPLLIYLLIPVFLLAAYIDLQVNKLGSVNNFTAAIESIVIIFYSMFLFYYVLKNLIFENLLSTPVFWINTGILFYFSGNLILFTFSKNIAVTDIKKYLILWTAIHTFFNVLFNILLSIGFWKTRKV